MASPSSGDDYYASLGNEPAQIGSGSEKKKIIKIVAKKASIAPTETLSPKTSQQSVSPQDTTPISNTEYETTNRPAEKLPEVQPYVSRIVKLPESGTLDL